MYKNIDAATHKRRRVLYMPSLSSVCLRREGQSSGQTGGEGKESRVISDRGRQFQRAMWLCHFGNGGFLRGESIVALGSDFIRNV